MHVETLIALAVQRALRPSLRGLAEQMGIKVASLSDWKTGKTPLPDERIRQLAKIAGQDAGPWLLLIHSEQDEGDLGKEWAKLYKRLGMAAMAMVLCIGAALPGRAQASITSDSVHVSAEHKTHPLCIMRNSGWGPPGLDSAGSGFGSSLACPTVPHAKRNSQHERYLQP